MLFMEWLAQWAAAKADKAKAKDEEAYRLTPAFVLKHLSQLSGELYRHSETFAVNFFMRQKELLDKHTSDQTVALQAVIDDKLSKAQGVFVSVGKMIAHEVKQLFHDREEQIAQQHQEFMLGFAALARQNEVYEQNATGRHVALLEGLRQVAAADQRNHDINFGTMIGLYENLTMQIQGLMNALMGAREKARYASHPSLDWIADNADLLIKFGDDLANLRDNNVPREIAMTQAIRSLRAMVMYGISDVKAALVKRTEAWDNG